MTRLALTLLVACAPTPRVAEPVRQATLSETVRGAGGFGHTGSR